MIAAISRKCGTAIELFSSAHIKSAGSVNIAPAARDSPAEPIVCTILFSRIESFLKIFRIIPIETTAAGMDADTVIPTRSPIYALAPPKITASNAPRITDVSVNSGITLSAGTYGLKFLLFAILILISVLQIGRYL